MFVNYKIKSGVECMLIANTHEWLWPLVAVLAKHESMVFPHKLESLLFPHNQYQSLEQ